MQSPEQKQPVRLCRQDGSEGVAETNVDIIAIHGLDAKSPDTWIWKENHNDPSEVGVNWLADINMLPSIAKRARIFTCDWPADLLETQTLAPNSFEELANRLLAGIQRKRSGYAHDRPIIFIASCLGGILLIKSLIKAKGDYLSIQTSTRGILFLATPFRGTKFKDIANWAEPSLRAWGFIRNRRVTRFIDLVGGLTPQLDELRRDFTHLAVSQQYTVHTFYERGYEGLYRKIPYLSTLFSPSKTQLVERDSATLDLDPHPTSFERPHVTMNKFSKCPEYEIIGEKVSLLLKRIRVEPSLWRAYEYITNNQYTSKRLAIVPLSGDELPIDQCYINLAIVRQSGENNRMKDQTGSPPFSIKSRLKVVTPDKNLQVDLTTLFEVPRELHDGNTRQPRRILIRGRAGVGKTTLCKKIVHDFIDRDKRLWHKHFERIFWVPLREVKKEGYVGFRLEEIFSRLYFNDIDDAKHREALARSVCDAVNGTERHDSLFILDGLDEVSELLDPDHAASSPLIRLLNSPNVIITMRPHIQLSDVNHVDLELETIGLYPFQTIEYLTKVVKDEKTAKGIQSFLQKRPLVQSLVRIPIHLDALCFTWDENLKTSSVVETMTTVYKGIVNRLWEKDALRLRRMEEDARYLVSELDIDLAMENEMKIIECLAFSGMYNNVIEFESENRDAIRKLINLNKKDNVCDGKLGNLSFGSLSLLRASASGRVPRPSYHFLHLTFQEFFAARYFTRQWEAGKELEYQDFKTRKFSKVHPDAFLGQEKYAARYDTVWRFVTGLIQFDRIPRFFQTIEQEPVDLIGPAHQRLVMHCLSEANAWGDEQRLVLESRLSQWALLECDLREYSLLAAESEFPDGALSSALRTGSPHQQMIIGDSAMQPGRCLSERAITALMDVIKNNHKDFDTVGFRTAARLGRQTKLSANAIEILVDLVKHQSHEELRGRQVAARASALRARLHSSELAAIALVDLFTLEEGSLPKFAALEAFRNQGELSKDESEALLRTICDSGSSYDVESCAAEALAKQRQLPEATAGKLIELVKSQRKWETATEILRSLKDLPTTAFTSLASLVSGGESSMIRCLAAEALQNKKDLPQAAVMELVTLFQRITDEADEAHEYQWGRWDQSALVCVGCALGNQRKLPENTVTYFLGLIKDRNNRGFVRAASIFALRNQVNLAIVSDALVRIFKPSGGSSEMNSLSEEYERDLEDSEGGIDTSEYDLEILGAAIEVLGDLADLPEPTVMTFVRLIEDGKCSDILATCLANQTNLPTRAIVKLSRLAEDGVNDESRSVALEALKKQSKLPDTTTRAAVRLISKSTVIPYHAMEILKGQITLLESTMSELLELIEDVNHGVFTREVATRVLQYRTDLPPKAVKVLLRLLKIENTSLQSIAASALGNQTNLSDDAIQDLIQLLRNNPMQLSCAKALGNQSTLVDKVAMAATQNLESGRPDHELLKYLYICYLHRGFREQFSLYQEKEGSLVTYMPCGTRLRSKALSGGILNAIKEGRKLCQANNNSLWQNPFGDDSDPRPRKRRRLR
ncbi:armadillo-type protein [Nemania sp. FL0031]|nr:armadillo-type protein [Nemania sp. FL0031]